MIQQESIEDIITRCYKKEKKKKIPTSVILFL